MKKSLPFVIFILISPIFLIAEEIKLPHIFTYIDSPVVEQRQVLTAENIEKLHVSDLPELMVAAGVQILSYGPYGLEQKPSIRGFTDETVRVIIDGICVNNAQYGTFDFTSLNIDDIERIEIVKGGFTEGVSDEGSVGGTIYITTKKQALGHHLAFNSSLKTFFNFSQPVDCFSQNIGYNGQFSEVNYLKANLKGTFAANRFLFKNFRGMLAERENAGVIDGNGTVNFLHYFGDGNSLAVNDLFYAGKKNIPGPENSKTPGLQQDYDNNFSIQLVRPEVAGIMRLENSISWLSNSRFYSDVSSDSAHFVNSFKYFGNADFYGKKNFKDVAGFTFDYTHLDSTDDGIQNQFTGTFKNTAKFSFSRFVGVFPLAVKFCNKNFAFTPKIGGGVKSSFVDLFIDGYKMVQFPNMDDLYWNDGINKGNPDLKPENGYGAEISANVHGIFIPFSVSVFTNYYENKIQWTGENGRWSPQNVASAFYFGIDGNFEKSFVNDRIIIKGNGEYLYTRLLDKTSRFYGKKIMWTPDFVGSLQCIFVLPAKSSFPGASVTVDANYMGKRYCSNLNVSYMKPYVLINLVAESEFSDARGKWKYKPYLRIDNLLNYSYESVENYPMPGISLSLGCRISY